MDKQINGQVLYNFLNRWRNKLVSKPTTIDDDKEFGQLLALNTIIAWIDDHCQSRKE